MPYADPAEAKAQRRRQYRRDPAGNYAKTREWQLANPERTRAAKSAYKARLRDWMESIKRTSGCVDCGTREGRLDFDHRPGTVKLFNPSRLDRTKREVLEAEIAKCDVRCASCHTRRHQLERAPATQCARGHDLTDAENVRVDKHGARRCRVCVRLRRHRWLPLVGT